MAYILGFFYANGNISNHQTILFSHYEKDILEKIRHKLDSNHPIHQDQKTGLYNLHMNSQFIKNDLFNHFKMVTSSSKEAEFPSVPTLYLNHFIRGYFDGKGHIYKSGYLIGFDGGSNAFMQELKNILTQRSFNTKLVTSEKQYQVYISGINSVNDFANWMYKHKNLYVKRKYELFHYINHEDFNLINEKNMSYRLKKVQ
ncbi:LAGLIDADG family homing endonuclease [Tenuibacillus multivorans]|nr:LAGLIDADG family homing endonuclease [Tenuibacillus multivorans]